MEENDIAPDYESEIDSLDSLDLETNICNLCLRGGGIMVHPCDRCEYGIQTAHAICFEEYRRSWPIDHPNRKQCPICCEEYSIQEINLIDMSQRRSDAYAICLYIVLSSNLFSVFTFIFNLYDITYFFYTVLLFIIMDLILSSIAVSKIKHRMRANFVIHVTGIILIYVGMQWGNMKTFLWVSSLILHAMMSRRLCYKYAELKN